MHKTDLRTVENRIVSIHQPHVRPMACGKAKAKVKFGAKIKASLHGGYTRVDHFNQNAFHEGFDLPARVERHKALTGHYSELVQVDKIYLTRENRRYLKKHGICHTGEPLGTKTNENDKNRLSKT